MLLGQFNDLTVTRHADFGLYLEDEGGGVAFLPLRTTPPYRPGEKVRLFVTTDIEGKAVATQKSPRAVVGEFAILKCVGGNPHGAYFDWGLDQDLFVPKSEQHGTIKTGDVVVVWILVDPNSGRVMGSTKLRKYLKPDASGLREGQAVQLLVYGFATGGALVIVDGEYAGMLFDDELHEEMHVGERKKGYVKRVRADGKLAISLLPQGYSAALERAPSILEALEQAGGFLPYSDSSNPDEIRRVFGMSKGTFKKAIGRLYREGLIEITYHGIRATKG